MEKNNIYSKALAKKIMAAALMVSVAATFYGCDNKDESQPVSQAESSSSSQSESSQEVEQPEAVSTAVIYVDRTGGSEVAEEMGFVTGYDVEYDGDLTVQMIADSLTEITNLQFTINDVTDKEDGIVIDWSADSTLIAGLGDIEQKEEFHMFDAVGLNWMMLDSLYRSVTENMPVENVYYTMDGGKEFIMHSDMEIPVLPIDAPYMGSVFYVSHADANGDIEDESVESDDSGAPAPIDIFIKAMPPELFDGKIVVSEGEDTVNGEHAWLIAIGTGTEDKFTAETHYAITDSYDIFVMDVVAGGEYVPYAMG